MTHYSKRSSSRRESQRKLPGLKKPAGSGSIRIIGGQWRGRKIPVAEAPGLRPTGDRVRETLFNWLMHDIPGSHCLDLFAGSGALGLESASRGAAFVALVEAELTVSRRLKSALGDLAAGDAVSLFAMSASAFLESNQRQFDIVFVDPPFALHLHRQTLGQLVGKHLSDNALVYLEMHADEQAIIDDLPDQLSVFRQKRFGDVTVCLLQYNHGV